MVTVTRSKVIGLVLALLVGGLVLAFWPREEPPVQEAITRKIIEMTRAAEEKNVSGVMDGVSERFKSGQGWGKDQLKGVMVAQVLRGQWLRIFHTDLEVTEVSPTQGDFSVRFIFARSDAQPVWGFRENGRCLGLASLCSLLSASAYFERRGLALGPE